MTPRSTNCAAQDWMPFPSAALRPGMTVVCVGVAGANVATVVRGGPKGPGRGPRTPRSANCVAQDWIPFPSAALRPGMTVVRVGVAGANVATVVPGGPKGREGDP